ncbi:MAG: hypothetical protein KAJ95_05005 [Gammaproteobacteria bacterium]|nr:hypothetical protein [Gammaproteobacteria bacterium]
MSPKPDNDVYRVIIDGYCLADAPKAQVVKKLQRLFGKPEQKILEMFDGQPTVIKKSLPKSKAYQYLRTITNAGAACHIDKLKNVDPEETTQLPVHVERNSFIQSLDPLGKIKKRIQQRNDFSEVMRQEIMEMDQVRKKSDVIIITLFIFLFLMFLAAVIFIFLA